MSGPAKQDYHWLGAQTAMKPASSRTLVRIPKRSLGRPRTPGIE